jgi:hypothetical protein
VKNITKMSEPMETQLTVTFSAAKLDIRKLELDARERQMEAYFDSRERSLDDTDWVQKQTSAANQCFQSLGTIKAEVDVRERDLDTLQTTMCLQNYELNTRELELAAREKDAVRVQTAIDLQQASLKKTRKALEAQEATVRDYDWDLKKRELELNRRLAVSGRPTNWPMFTLFPKLPIEIRLKIWDNVETLYDEARIPAIRGIPYHVLKSKPSYHSRTKLEEDLEQVEIRMKGKWGPCTYDRVAYPSPHGVDPTLHSCREARQHVIKKWNLEWAFETFVNLDLDIIFPDLTPFSEESGDVGETLAGIRALDALLSDRRSY